MDSKSADSFEPKSNAPKFHIPVMVKEVIEGLITDASGTYVDCTFGEGGHTLEILKKIVPFGGRVIGIDKDLQILQYAEERLKEYKDSFFLFHSNFTDLKLILKGLNIPKVNGLLFDLGVSSFQLDQEDRGFSFMTDGPLDMRMDLQFPLKAEDVINTFTEYDLEKIIREYGEEPFSKSIARRILERRPFHSTAPFVEAIQAGIPVKVRKTLRKHFATRTFQAFRIYVNRELDELANGLEKSLQILEKDGRIISISFHSLEDRLVKNFFKQQSETTLRILTKKPLVPEYDEVIRNRRSHSAKMRIAEKL